MFFCIVCACVRGGELGDPGFLGDPGDPGQNPGQNPGQHSCQKAKNHLKKVCP